MEMTYGDSEVQDFLEWLYENYQVVLLPKTEKKILEDYQSSICKECGNSRNNHEDWCYYA
jgi:hypothetical protein